MKTFIGNTNLEEGFVSEYKNVENKEYQKDSLDTKEDDNLENKLDSKLNIIQNKK